jgi:hypothetical protein
MSVVANVQEQVRKRIAELEPRVAELQPLAAELEELRAIEQSFKGLPSHPATRSKSSSNGRRRTPRTRTNRSRTAAKPRRARSTTGSRARETSARRNGGRAEQALQIIKAKPGVTVADVAKEMGINDNYLYRVIPGLQKQGKVKKQGKGWHPARAKTAA